MMQAGGAHRRRADFKSWPPSRPGPRALVLLMTQSRNQHQLADGTARLDKAMGRRRFREREGLADQNFELAFAHQVETLLGALAHQLVIRRRGVEHEAADLKRFLEQAEHVELVRRAARASVQDGMAEGRETAD